MRHIIIRLHQISSTSYKSNPHMALTQMSCSLCGTSMWSCVYYESICYDVMPLVLLHLQPVRQSGKAWLELNA